jgi:hypothetical protein
MDPQVTIPVIRTNGEQELKQATHIRKSTAQLKRVR